jgi:hypothetical protein
LPKFPPGNQGQMKNISEKTKNQSKHPPSPHVGGGAAAVGGGEALPCLYSNNSIGTPNDVCSIAPSIESVTSEKVLNLASLLSPYHKKAAQTLYLNVERLVEKECKDISHLGFMTLTFPDNVTDHEQAYNRFRSFNTNYLSKSYLFGSWVCVKERQKRGAWHYHLLIDCKEDIKGSIKFAELEKCNYASAGENLRKRWTELRNVLSKYGFGRSELLPVKSNSEAMGRYVGKYISKHIDSRDDRDKGVRLVNYSRDWVKNSCKFAWHTDGAKEWRQKLKLWASAHGFTEFYQITESFGSDWAYKYADEIFHIHEAILDQTSNTKDGQTVDTITGQVVQNRMVLSSFSRPYTPKIITYINNKPKKRTRKKCKNKKIDQIELEKAVLRYTVGGSVRHIGQKNEHIIKK